MDIGLKGIKNWLTIKSHGQTSHSKPFSYDHTFENNDDVNQRKMLSRRNKIAFLNLSLIPIYIPSEVHDNLPPSNIRKCDRISVKWEIRARKSSGRNISRGLQMNQILWLWYFANVNAQDSITNRRELNLKSPTLYNFKCQECFWGGLTRRRRHFLCWLKTKNFYKDVYANFAYNSDIYYNT